MTVSVRAVGRARAHALPLARGAAAPVWNRLSLAVTGIRLPLCGGSEHPAVSGQDGTRTNYAAGKSHRSRAGQKSRLHDAVGVQFHSNMVGVLGIEAVASHTLTQLDKHH